MYFDDIEKKIYKKIKDKIVIYSSGNIPRSIDNEVIVEFNNISKYDLYNLMNVIYSKNKFNSIRQIIYVLDSKKLYLYDSSINYEVGKCIVNEPSITGYNYVSNNNKTIHNTYDDILKNFYELRRTPEMVYNPSYISLDKVYDVYMKIINELVNCHEMNSYLSRTCVICDKLSCNFSSSFDYDKEMLLISLPFDCINYKIDNKTSIFKDRSGYGYITDNKELYRISYLNNGLISDYQSFIDKLYDNYLKYKSILSGDILCIESVNSNFKLILGNKLFYVVDNIQNELACNIKEIDLENVKDNDFSIGIDLSLETKLTYNHYNAIKNIYVKIDDLPECLKDYLYQEKLEEVREKNKVRKLIK